MVDEIDADGNGEIDFDGARAQPVAARSLLGVTPCSRGALTRMCPVSHRAAQSLSP